LAWSQNHPAPEYLNYWHWLLDNHFIEFNNSCVRYLPVKDILNDAETPGWAEEITQKIFDEFQDVLDASGGLKIKIQS